MGLMADKFDCTANWRNAPPVAALCFDLTWMSSMGMKDTNYHIRKDPIH